MATFEVNFLNFTKLNKSYQSWGILRKVNFGKLKTNFKSSGGTILQLRGERNWAGTGKELEGIGKELAISGGN